MEDGAGSHAHLLGPKLLILMYTKHSRSITEQHADTVTQQSGDQRHRRPPETDDIIEMVDYSKSGSVSH